MHPGHRGEADAARRATEAATQQLAADRVLLHAQRRGLLGAVPVDGHQRVAPRRARCAQRPDHLSAPPLALRRIGVDVRDVDEGEVAPRLGGSPRQPLRLLLEVLTQDLWSANHLPSRTRDRTGLPAVREVHQRHADHGSCTAGHIDLDGDLLARLGLRKHRELDTGGLIHGLNVLDQGLAILGRELAVAALPGLDQGDVLVLGELLLRAIGRGPGQRREVERGVAGRTEGRRIGLIGGRPAGIGQRGARAEPHQGTEGTGGGRGTGSDHRALSSYSGWQRAHWVRTICG